MLSVPLELSVASRPPALTQRALEVASMFGLGLDDADTHRVSVIPPTTLPLPPTGSGITLITGPSGSGKSSLLRLIASALRERGTRVIDLNGPDADLHHHGQTNADLCVIDRVAPDQSLAEALRICSLAGLSDAFVLLRRPGELSDGQRFRFRVASAIASAMASAIAGPARPSESMVILIDEFAATLDRITARALARSLRRWCDREPRVKVMFALATTHEDLADALEPDVHVRKGLGPAIEIAMRPTQPQASRGEGDHPDPPVDHHRHRHCHHHDQPHHQNHDEHDHDQRVVDGALADMRIERGTLADYRALSAFHYRSHHVGAATSVLRLVAGAQVVGVLVRALPALACAMRDLATAGRYAAHLSPRERAGMLNREVRCIARVVIDPRYRGMGLAVTLVRHALEHPEHERIVFTEALAAMGRVSPFFEKAGMRRFDRPAAARPAHARLADALDHAGLQPGDLASRAHALQALQRLPPAEARWLRDELRHFLRAARRMTAAQARALDDAQLIVAARERLLLQPVYFLFAHRPTRPSPRPAALPCVSFS
jgi:energy-coupling factor transporter ATP-binding protein EcfA2/GNAT superfamily N-acetyltransferase